MHRSILRVATVAAAALALAACGTNSAGQPTVAGSLTVPGTNLAVADVAAQVDQQCAMKAPTDTLLNGIAVAAGATPEVSLALMGVEAVGGLACTYLKATAAAVPTTAAPAAPVPAPSPLPPSTPPAVVLPAVIATPASPAAASGG